MKKPADSKVLRYRHAGRFGLLTREGGEAYLAWKRDGTMPAPDVARAEIDREQRFLARMLAPIVRRWPRGALMA